jgi:hypothetical protein
MKCRDMKVKLSAYANSELSQIETDMVEQHLTGCQECRATLDAYRTIRQKVSALQNGPTKSEIKEAVMAKIREKGTGEKKRVKWLKPALVAIPVVAAIIAGLMLWQPWGIGGGYGGFISRVKAAANGLQYYKAHTVHEVSQGYNANTIYYEVAFAAPDRYRIEARDNTRSGGTVHIGGKVYSWGEQPIIPQIKMTGLSGTTVSSIGIPTKNEMLQMIDSLKDMKQFPDEAIDGVVCLHYRGDIVSNESYDNDLDKLNQNDPSYSVMKELFEKMDNWLRSQKIEVEIWIGKGDYLPRKERYYAYIPPYTPQDEAYTLTRTTEYYDFNVAVEIEPPLDAEANFTPGSSLDVDYDLLSKYALNGSQNMGIEGEDPAHQKVNFSTTITNRSTETVRNVRILVSTITTSGQEVHEIMEALPSSGRQVDLGAGESETFSLSWEFLSKVGNDSLSEVLNATEVEARYIRPDGEEFIQPFPRQTAATTPDK